MTHAEADQAMTLQVPVVHQGSTYERISGLIYRKSAKSGGLVASAELLSPCGHSVTIARLDRTAWLNPEDGERQPLVLDAEEAESPYQEVRAKEAFLSGEELLYEGERWVVTALILRKWLERVYWVSLELSSVSDRKVQEVWSGSIVFAEAKAG